MGCNDAFLRSMEKYYKGLKSIGHMRFVDKDLLDAIQIYKDPAAILSGFSYSQFSSIIENGQFMRQIADKIDFSEVLAIKKDMLDFPVLTTFELSNQVLEKLTAINKVAFDRLLNKNYASDFADSIQTALTKADLKQPVKFNEVVRDVVDVLAESDEVEKTAEQISEEISEGPFTTKKIKDSIAFQIFLQFGPVLLSCILSLFVNYASTNPTVIQDNSVKTVNNYYTKEMGIESSLMNEFNWRIVNCEKIKPRIKPDCSSRVVGQLTIGRVVCEIDKKKKWRQIMWQDEKGKHYSGWIQNYKLSKFKQERK